MKVAGLASGSDGNAAWGTSRESGWDKFVGGFTDSISNVANFYDGQAVSSDTMYVGPDGKVHPRTCFVAGTLVHTRDGLKAIEEIKVGDVVTSWNEVTKEVSYKPVTELFAHDVELIFDVEIDNKEKLQTTWNHPFWVVEKQTWVEVKDLEVGDTVLLNGGNVTNITNITSYNVLPTPVYNFEVADNHTYFVGKNGVLVHNYIGEAVAAMTHGINSGPRVFSDGPSGFFGGIVIGLINNVSVLLFTKEANEFAVGDGKRTHTAENALRHGYWQARMTSAVDDQLAQQVGDAHENVSNPNEIADSQADQFNNRVGQQIGNQLKGASSEQIRQAILNAYNSGQFREVRPTPEYEQSILNEMRSAIGGQKLSKVEFEKKYYTRMVEKFYKSPEPGKYILVPSGPSAPPALTREQLMQRIGITLEEK